MTHRAGRGIENHAVAYYRAIKKFEKEDKEYTERVSDRKTYNVLYSSEQREDFKLRRGYLRHKVEEARKALFMSIESDLENRGNTIEN